MHIFPWDFKLPECRVEHHSMDAQWTLSLLWEQVSGISLRIKIDCISNYHNYAFYPLLWKAYKANYDPIVSLIKQNQSKYRMLLSKSDITSYIYIFFNFTILYWFCHTSTWIRHRCICVPNPEPPSYLPPHTIPLGHPSATAPSILYYASNLDWRFVYQFRDRTPALQANYLPLSHPGSPSMTHKLI